jgi:hypothetical protein
MLLGTGDALDPLGVPVAELVERLAPDADRLPGCAAASSSWAACSSAARSSAYDCSSMPRSHARSASLRRNVPTARDDRGAEGTGLEGRSPDAVLAIGSRLANSESLEAVAAVPADKLHMRHAQASRGDAGVELDPRTDDVKSGEREKNAPPPPSQAREDGHRPGQSLTPPPRFDLHRSAKPTYYSPACGSGSTFWDSHRSKCTQASIGGRRRTKERQPWARRDSNPHALSSMSS